MSGNDIVSASINFSSSDFFSTPLTVNLNMFGDAGGNITNHGVGGNDTLIAQFTGSPDFVSTTVNIYGDAGGSLSEHAIGGNDVIVGPDAGNGSNSIVNLFGDAGTNLTGYAVGGDDVITGGTTIIGSGATLKIFGDAGENMTDHAIGGNDLIVADFSRHQFLFGDAGNDMSGYAKGGNDQIILGNTTGANELFRLRRRGWKHVRSRSRRERHNGRIARYVHPRIW